MMNKKGFTLVELMIVVAIIGILAAIAIPNFVAMQYRAKRSEVPSNVDGIKTAELAYDAAFDTYIQESSFQPDSSPGKKQRNWITSLSLPAVSSRHWWTPQQVSRLFAEKSFSANALPAWLMHCVM